MQIAHVAVILWLVPVCLAALLGFAAHRASICTVRAVAELLSSRQAYALRAIAKSILWVLFVMAPASLLVLDFPWQTTGYAVSAISILGGFLFGIGAVMNGGCAFSTLTQLADGRLRMLATFAGLCLGALSGVALGYPQTPTDTAWTPKPNVGAATWPIVATAVLCIWGAIEAGRLWRTRQAYHNVLELFLSHRYRLSTAAALMGLSNGVLYLLVGPWAYTGTVRDWVGAAALAGASPSPMRWLLFISLLGGMILSTWQRRSFNLEWQPHSTWLWNLAGGILMGCGISLVPGGNDFLVFHGIPSLSPHALPAYVAMISGIAAGLMAMRRLTRTTMTVRCEGGHCIVLEQTLPIRSHATTNRGCEGQQ